MTGLMPRRVLPILMYHRLGKPVGGDRSLWIDEETFVRQLGWLQENGYETLSVHDAVVLQASNRAPRNTVLITIDDAFSETLTVAAGALRDFAMRATVFVAAGLMGQEVELGSPNGEPESGSAGHIADRDQLIAWTEQGLDIGSHSMTHADLTRIQPEQILNEAGRSKELLEELLGVQIEDFCYPYAHHNSICRKLVARCGYRAAFAGEPPVRNLFAIPRMMVYPQDSLTRFRRKASGYYYWLSAWHRRISFRGMKDSAARETISE